MRFFAGDPGGCTDARCRPWGKTFIQLCEEMAAIWLKYHPKSIVLIANQGLDNAGEKAIFDYYKEKPRTWSYGIAYGPGSNPMSRYFRRELRNDLFTSIRGRGRWTGIWRRCCMSCLWTSTSCITRISRTGSAPNTR